VGKNINNAGKGHCIFYNTEQKIQIKERTVKLAKIFSPGEHFWLYGTSQTI
jgi:hypothetical protein